MNYAAVIADLVGSRKAERRDQLQDQLQQVTGYLSLHLHEYLAAPIQLVRGDEIQALLTRADKAVDFIQGLTDSLRPQRAVFGLGWGEIHTALSEDVTAIDGPCFHNARDGLQSGKKKRLWVSVVGFGGSRDSSLTALFGLMAAVRSGWTDRQAEIANLYREKKQIDVADQLGVSKSVVSESLTAAHVDAVLAGESAASSLLQEFASFAELDESSANMVNPIK